MANLIHFLNRLDCRLSVIYCFTMIYYASMTMMLFGTLRGIEDIIWLAVVICLLIAILNCLITDSIVDSAVITADSHQQLCFRVSDGVVKPTPADLKPLKKRLRNLQRLKIIFPTVWTIAVICYVGQLVYWSIELRLRLVGFAVFCFLLTLPMCLWSFFCIHYIIKAVLTIAGYESLDEVWRQVPNTASNNDGEESLPMGVRLHHMPSPANDAIEAYEDSRV